MTPHKPYVRAGLALKSHRVSAGMSQSQVCEKSNGSIKLGTLRSWEQGASVPDARLLMTLQTIIGFPADEYLSVLRAEVAANELREMS